MASLSEYEELLRDAAADFLDQCSFRRTSLINREQDKWDITYTEYGLYPKTIHEAGPFSGEQMIEYAVTKGFDKEAAIKDIQKTLRITQLKRRK